MNKKNHKPEYGIRSAAFLQFISKYINIAIQLIVTALLARLISPEDFGFLSIVTAFTAFFQLFSDMGIGVAVVQYQDLTERDYGKLFVFSSFLAFFLAILFCILATPISLFFGERQLALLCWATAPSIIFNTLNMVPNGLMLKDRQFGAIAFRLVVSTLVSGTIAVLLAAVGAGCYAVAAQNVFTALIILIWNLSARPIHHLSIHFAEPLKHVFSYSAYQFGFSLINYFSRNLDNLVIGRVLGTVPLGYYDKAYKLTTYPMSSLSSVVASVIQPYMAENQDNPDRIFHCWYKVTKLLSLLGAFITAVFVAAAPEIIMIFYGRQWAPAIPLFQALSISVYFQMLGNPSGAFFQSLGRTDLMFKQGLINTIFTVTGLAIGTVIGTLQAVAICISVAFCLEIFPIVYYLLVRGMHVSLKITLKFLPEICTIFIACLVNYLLVRYMSFPVFFVILLKISIISAIFLICYILTGNIKYLNLILKGK